MDHAVSIVEAYLQINGYFTVAEFPVIESLASGQYETATDLDILAIRFPGAGRLVAFGATKGKPGFKHSGMITLGHIVSFIENYLRAHWEVLRHTHFSNPALGLLMVREKARQQARGGE